MKDNGRNRAMERAWLVDAATKAALLYLLVGDEVADRLGDIVRRNNTTLDEYLAHLQDDLLEWVRDAQNVFPPWDVVMEGMNLAESLRDINDILSDIENKTGDA